MLLFDHLAVTATTLDEGVAAVEAALGVALAPGGRHPHMATHNRLLALGDLYLEVIATDPDAPPPAWPRWFAMDRFRGPPRVTNWIARSDDLDADVALSPAGVGAPVALTRGDFRWRMAVPADGELPFDGAFPALMQWEGAAHPALRLPESDVRLTRLEIAHPQAEAVALLLTGRIDDARLDFVTAAEPALRATFITPHGVRVLD